MLVSQAIAELVVQSSLSYAEWRVLALHSSFVFLQTLPHGTVLVCVQLAEPDVTYKKISSGGLRQPIASVVRCE